MKDFLRHFFTPHQTNNHRPKILHHTSLSIIVVFLLCLAFIQPRLQRNYPSVLGTSVNVSIEDLLQLTNQKRAEAGLAPLVMNNELKLAAADKAKYMLEKNFWAHVAPDGTTPWYFIKNAGYEYLYAGENLARGYNSAPDVINAWMASPSHRENMLSPHYNDIGFAVVSGSLTGSDTVLVVEEFGSKYLAEKKTSEKTSEPIEAINPSPNPIHPTPSEIQPTSKPEIAAAVNKPLVDSKSTTRNLAFILLGVIIIVLIADLIIIERKKIVQATAHNLDHIIFLSILLLAAIIIGTGAIL